MELSASKPSKKSTSPSPNPSNRTPGTFPLLDDDPATMAGRPERAVAGGTVGRALGWPPVVTWPVGLPGHPRRHPWKGRRARPDNSAVT
ncbi:hypothetical protein GCM10023222_57500 [Saccharopolyspora cebuensis]